MHTRSEIYETYKQYRYANSSMNNIYEIYMFWHYIDVTLNLFTLLWKWKHVETLAFFCSSPIKIKSTSLKHFKYPLSWLRCFRRGCCLFSVIFSETFCIILESTLDGVAFSKLKKTLSKIFSYEFCETFQNTCFL